MKDGKQKRKPKRHKSRGRKERNYVEFSFCCQFIFFLEIENINWIRLRKFMLNSTKKIEKQIKCREGKTD